MSNIDSTAIESAAFQLAQAEANAGEAISQHTDAKMALDRIDNRMDTLREKRESIITAARQNPKNPQHALDLAVVDADLDDLGQERTEAQAAVDAAHKRQEAAKASLTTARLQFQRAEDEATEAALTENLQRLDVLMLENIQQLAEANRRAGSPRPTWTPSRQLTSELRRIQLLTGSL